MQSCLRHGHRLARRQLTTVSTKVSPIVASALQRLPLGRLWRDHSAHRTLAFQSTDGFSRKITTYSHKHPMCSPCFLRHQCDPRVCISMRQTRDSSTAFVPGTTLPGRPPCGPIILAILYPPLPPPLLPHAKHFSTQRPSPDGNQFIQTESERRPVTYQTWAQPTDLAASSVKPKFQYRQETQPTVSPP